MLDRDVDDWIDQALSLSGLQLADITRAVLVDSCRLPPPFHGNPAAQIIVATARRHGAHLVTANTRIRGYAHVQSLW